MTAFERLRLILGGVAVFLWTLTIIVDIVKPGYDPPQSVQLVTLIIAGALFAPTVVKKVNGVKRDDG